MAPVNEEKTIPANKMFAPEYVPFPKADEIPVTIQIARRLPAMANSCCLFSSQRDIEATSSVVFWVTIVSVTSLTQKKV